MNQKDLKDLATAIGAIILLALLILVLFVFPTHGMAWFLNWLGWNPY